LIKHIVVAALLVTGSLSIVTSEAVAAGQCGTASWYGPGFNGKKAASGERFNQNAMTAAHKTLPFGTRLKVTNQKTGKSVTVKINDRGPYHGGRVIDLSKAAASQLGIVNAGTGKVCLTKV
jgi:rare lipoprotein A